MLDALPALDAVSACDSTSSFHRIGKHRIYKVVKSADHFKAALVQMGDTFDLDMDHFPALQEIIAQCYSIKGCDSINDACYRKFCMKAKVPEAHKLPPTKDELLFHQSSASIRIWLASSKWSVGKKMDEPKTSTRFFVRISGLQLQKVRLPEQQMCLHIEWTQLHRFV